MDLNLHLGLSREVINEDVLQFCSTRETASTVAQSFSFNGWDLNVALMDEEPIQVNHVGPPSDEVDDPPSPTLSTFARRSHMEESDFSQMHLTGQFSTSSSEIQGNNSGSVSSQNRKKRKEMSKQELKRCVETLLHESKDMILPKGAINRVAARFDVSRWTVQRVWKQVKECVNANIFINVTRKRTGRKKKIILDEAALMSIPLRKRCNIRSLAAALGISKSTVHRFVKWGKIRRHNSTLRPGLTTKNEVQRMEWCLKQLQQETINTNPQFMDNYNVIHIDEKWFVLHEISKKYYLAPLETNPYRCTKNKNYITKIMFLVAVAKPRFNDDGDCTFDGKIGVFPLIEMVPAKRNSCNRPAGTLEVKPIQNITRDVIRDKFIRELLPAIRAKWPLDDDGVIYIQQDNATPRMQVIDEEFKRECNKDGFKIELIQQPPNSPDLNVLDLGFFRAIQAIQHQCHPKDYKELVDAVTYAFDVFDPKKLEYVWLTLQYVMLEIMRASGGNNYNIPHKNKERMSREGTLPSTLEISHADYAQAVANYRAKYFAWRQEEAEKNARRGRQHRQPRQQSVQVPSMEHEATSNNV